MAFPSIKTPIPGPLSKDYAKRLQECESGITYLSDSWPIFWERAEGNNVWDVDGNCFLDFNAAFGVCGLGHNNPAIVKAIEQGAKELIHGMGDVHPSAWKVKLCERILSCLPSVFGKVILSCNGSDACETALKTAQLKTQNSEIIAFRGAYHGLGYGSLSVTERDLFRKPFEGRLAISHFVDFPVTEDEASQALAQISSLLKKDSIAGIILEPIQGRAGVRVAAKGFLGELRRLCDRYGIVLIFDEIYTGLGRTGKLFAFQEERVIPDIICLGKLLGGGLPLSACVGTDEVMRKAWLKSKGEAIHTSTFLGNPLACRASLAVLEELQRNNWPAIVKQKGEYLKNQLQEKLSAKVRGSGLMLGIEFADQSLAKKIVAEGLKRGLIMLPCAENGEILCVSPPFTISYEEMDCLTEMLYHLISQI